MRHRVLFAVSVLCILYLISTAIFDDRTGPSGKQERWRSFWYNSWTHKKTAESFSTIQEASTFLSAAIGTSILVVVLILGEDKKQQSPCNETEWMRCIP